MCDPDGEYHFSNGDVYKGSFKTSAKLDQNRYGSMDGSGTLILKNLGILKATFMNGLVDGDYKFQFFGSTEDIK